MAKREFIERENLINELTESSKHHAQTSREESLLYRDRQIVREQPTITEQEIVKPYLEKLKEEIKNITTIGTYDYCLGAEHERKEVLSIIDSLLSEQEAKHGSD